MKRSEYLALFQLEPWHVDDLLAFVRSVLLTTDLTEDGQPAAARETFWADFIVFLERKGEPGTMEENATRPGTHVPDVAIDEAETLDLDRRLLGAVSTKGKS